MRKFKILPLLLLLLTLATSAAAQKKTQKTYIPWSNGKLVVSEEGRYLKHENGTPFFWLGETGWLLPERLNRDEAEYYLEQCKRRGYNVIQVQTLNNVPSMNIYGQYSMTDGYNFKNINQKGVYGYWDHMDYIIRTAAKKGLYIGMVCIWGSPVSHGEMNVDQAKAYGKFLAERYKDEPNIIWFIGGDIRGDVKTAEWEALATSIKAIDKNHLITRRLLQLLEKLLDQLELLHSSYRNRLTLSSDYQRRFSVIQTVLEQGKNLFAGKKVSNRIVSIDRHYLRPIIRGKETKSVEFGAKVNNIQIDGISFIEHISFKAFNEGVRLKDCIHLQQQLTKVRVKALAADSIYANNANRKFCTKYHISTSFKRKGRAAKDEPLRKILRSELSRERATRLEGSFGTQKQHYSLARIKARNRKTEMLWIFFGIHTANAVCMIEKVEKKKRTAA